MWTHFSNAFCSCCRLLFWKSRSFVYWVKLMKIPFFCNTIWPGDHSDVLLKRKQACDCCSALQAAIELSDGRNDKVAFSHQNNSKIIKRNSSKFCRLARQNSPSLCTKWYCKFKFYCQYVPTLFYLVWLLTTVNQHSEFGCQEISGTEHIKYIKIQ